MELEPSARLGVPPATSRPGPGAALSRQRGREQRSPSRALGTGRGAAAGACWGRRPLTMLLLSRPWGPVLHLTSARSALPETPAAIRAPAPGKRGGEVLGLVQ